jgi:hypothetical protein
MTIKRFMENDFWKPKEKSPLEFAYGDIFILEEVPFLSDLRAQPLSWIQWSLNALSWVGSERLKVKWSIPRSVPSGPRLGGEGASSVDAAGVWLVGKDPSWSAVYCQGSTGPRTGAAASLSHLSHQMNPKLSHFSVLFPLPVDAGSTHFQGENCPFPIILPHWLCDKGTDECPDLPSGIQRARHERPTPDHPLKQEDEPAGFSKSYFSGVWCFLLLPVCCKGHAHERWVPGSGWNTSEAALNGLSFLEGFGVTLVG